MKKLNNKKGISLIVLVITITSTYDETNKIDRFPSKNKIIYDSTFMEKVEVNQVIQTSLYKILMKFYN